MLRTVAGYETARSLASHGAHVIMAARNMRSAIEAADQIRREWSEANIEAMLLDLASLKTVRQFANSFIKRQMYVYFCLHENFMSKLWQTKSYLLLADILEIQVLRQVKK